MGRRCALTSIAALSVGFSCAAAGNQTVLLATTRNGWIDAIDPVSLQTLGRFSIGAPVEGAAAMKDGRTLLVAKDRDVEPKGCCGLFTLDLNTRILKPLLDIAQAAVANADGRKIFAQRGNVGIDVFDGGTFARLPTIDAPGFYDLHPSPDGLWLYGTSSGAHASLDIFDLAQGKLARHIELPYELPRGTWLNDQFVLYALDGNAGRLWAVTTDTTELAAGVEVHLPDLAAECTPVVHVPIGINGRLFLYEAFGHKLDRRQRCSALVRGGVFEIDPANGAVLSHLAPSRYFSQLVAGRDGRTLYGIDLPSSGWNSPHLIKIDIKSGAILAEGMLDDGVWSLNIAEIPEDLVPHRTVQIALH